MTDLPAFLRQLRPKEPTEAYYECAFRHGTTDAHTLWWPNLTNVGRQMSLMFIPGNPGLLKFYTPFLDFIYNEACSAGYRLSILAHSHLGHTPLWDVAPDSARLITQVECAIEALDAVRHNLEDDAEVVLVGHSVGSWICTQVLKARPLAVTEVFLLFPTISAIASTPNGRRLSWLFHNPLPAFISKLSVLTNFVPDWLLGRLFYHWPLPQRLVLRGLLRSPPAIACALTMAHDEMNTIKELDVDLLRRHSRELCFFFAEKDDWVGDQREVVLSAIDNTSSSFRIVHGEKDIPHAFCINHGELLASQCFRWLCELRADRKT